jgi:hypothetical protein
MTPRLLSTGSTHSDAPRWTHRSSRNHVADLQCRLGQQSTPGGAQAAAAWMAACRGCTGGLDAAGTGYGVVSITATDQVNSAPNWAIAWSEDLWEAKRDSGAGVILQRAQYCYAVRSCIAEGLRSVNALCTLVTPQHRTKLHAPSPSLVTKVLASQLQKSIAWLSRDHN